MGRMSPKDFLLHLELAKQRGYTPILEYCRGERSIRLSKDGRVFCPITAVSDMLFGPSDWWGPGFYRMHGKKLGLGRMQTHMLASAADDDTPPGWPTAATLRRNMLRSLGLKEF